MILAGLGTDVAQKQAVVEEWYRVERPYMRLKQRLWW